MAGAALFCLLASLGQSGISVESPSDASPASQIRPYREIDRDVRNLLQREARATAKGERASAANAMIAVLEELRRDPRLPDSPALKQYRGRLIARLRRIADDILRDLPAGSRQRLSMAAASRARALDPQAGHKPAGPGLATYGQSRTQAVRHARGGGPAPDDWGPALVSLIERTIAPEFWDVHGGPGTVYYYRPQRALVVRATSEIHGDVRGLLGDLRAAGP